MFAKFVGMQGRQGWLDCKPMLDCVEPYCQSPRVLHTAGGIECSELWLLCYVCLAVAVADSWKLFTLHLAPASLINNCMLTDLLMNC
jgi:hypothetical protein